MLTNEIRLNALSSASAAQFYFLANADSIQTYSGLLKKYQLEDKSKLFLVTIGDIILGFYQIEDTVPLLEQELGIDSATAEKLGQEVLAFLAPLNDPTWEPPVEEEVDEDANAESIVEEGGTTMSFADNEAVSIPIQSTRIPIKAPAITAPQPLHTYAHDMEVVRHPEAFEDAIPAPTSPEPVVPATPMTPVEAPVAAMTPSTPLPSFIHTTPTPVTSPTSIASTPTSTSEPMTARVPLEPLPSYTPPAVPIITPPVTATSQAPDRPRWSTDI